jgi:hypothetical protein
LLNPPREEHQRFSLYYEFTCVISAMVSKETVDAVDSQKFMQVFLDICPQFHNDERTYCVVVSTNELSYIHLSILLINFLFFQTSEDAHKYITYLRECQLKELQPKQEDASVTAYDLLYDKHLHQSMQSFWNRFTSGMMKQTFICQQCNTVTTQNESFNELMLKFPLSHHSEQGKTCTLNFLFEHNRSLPSDIEDYVCNCCKERTIATLHEEISLYPEFLVVVLCREIGIDKVNEKNINVSAEPASTAATAAAATAAPKHQPGENATMNLDRNEDEIVDLLDDYSEESSLFSSSAKNDDDIPLPPAPINFKLFVEREEGHDCAIC